MILLRRDCLVFETSDGEQIPCAVEHVTIELLGEAAQALDGEVVKNAAEAVLHYFKTELGQTTVSIREFSAALKRVLRRLGVQAPSSLPAAPAAPFVVESDLRLLAGESGGGLELFFFQQLRNELRLKLEHAPRVVRFCGLRGSVKKLTGAKRWSLRCQNLNDQIVEYLRTCLNAEARPRPCALVVI